MLIAEVKCLDGFLKLEQKICFVVHASLWQFHASCWQLCADPNHSIERF
jgi:hypothetical protein